MFNELGISVLAADIDPQANLTSMFLEDDRLEEIWRDSVHGDPILGMVNPILNGTGDIADPHVERIPYLEHIRDQTSLLVGDLGLSIFEDRLSNSWPRCLNGDEAASRVISAFYRGIEQAALK